MSALSEGKLIVFFDGDCKFCSRWVLFIISRDGYDRFRFSTLHAPEARPILAKFNIRADTSDTFYIVENDHIYSRSAGVLHIFKNLPGLWPALFVFRLIPPFIRDGVYNFFARNRYKWFGKRDECFVPGEDNKSKFEI